MWLGLMELQILLRWFWQVQWMRMSIADISSTMQVRFHLVRCRRLQQNRAMWESIMTLSVHVWVNLITTIVLSIVNAFGISCRSLMMSLMDACYTSIDPVFVRLGMMTNFYPFLGCEKTDSTVNFSFKISSNADFHTICKLYRLFPFIFQIWGEKLALIPPDVGQIWDNELTWRSGVDSSKGSNLQCNRCKW